MTRRLKSKTRKYAGNRTFGGGNTKNRRGKGSKGGRGRAGYHKHKWLRTAKYELAILAKNHKGFNANSLKQKVVTIEQLNRLIRKSGSKELNFMFPNAKIIGSTPLDGKATITAALFTKGARESITKAGGTMVTPTPKLGAVTTTPAATPAKAKKAKAEKA